MSFPVSCGTPFEAEEAIDALKQEYLMLKVSVSEYLLAAQPTRDDSH